MLLDSLHYDDSYMQVTRLISMIFQELIAVIRLKYWCYKLLYLKFTCTGSQISALRVSTCYYF